MRKVLIASISICTLVLLGCYNLFAQQEAIHNFNPSDKQINEYIKWLKEPSVFGREEAADALGRSHNPKAIKPLLEALKDTAPSVRQHPAGYLGDFGDTKVIPNLIEALRKEHENESDAHPELLLIQSNLIGSLKKLGISLEQEKEIMPYIENLLEKEGGRFAPKISDIKNSEVKNQLYKKIEKLANSSNDLTVKFNAVEKLVYEFNNDPKKYEDLCINILNTRCTQIDETSYEYSDEKAGAIRLLEKIKTKKSISAVEKALNDEDRLVRSLAKKVLKRLGK